MSKPLTAAVWLLAAVTLVGCLILPIPIPPAGKTGEVTGRLRVGSSTRSEVHALLGAPNRLATPRHEVWELEREPFKLFLVAVVGGPGGGLGGAETFRFGRTILSRVVVDYDLQGKVTGWRWEGTAPEPSEGEDAPRDSAHGASEPVSVPPKPVRILTWTAQSFALSPDGSRAALLETPAGRKQLQIVELATGRRIAESRDWLEACGVAAITLEYDGTHVQSVARNPAQGVGLCRWRTEGGSLLADAVISSALAKESVRVRLARLIDRFLVIGQIDGGASIWDLSSDLGTTLPPVGTEYLATTATVNAKGTMLAIETVDGRDAPPALLLYDLVTGARRTLALSGPAHDRVAALALTPEGDALAVHRQTHIEVWRLHGPHDSPVLETVLLPSSTIRAALAFSDDGQRLVAASTYALVWDTHSWREIGRGAPGTFENAVTPSDQVEISPDGSYIATCSGLWRIAPERIQSIGANRSDH